MSKGIKNYKDLKLEDKNSLLQYIDKAIRFTSEKKLLNEKLDLLKKSLADSSGEIQEIEDA
ncbi:MAG: hypothetical protein NE330_13445, partial [Lentisphaeraceae bacterium]|nr:hypothetical protein [Lentisphaeraceae bacterium]